MNWDRVSGNWKQFKGQAKQKWAKLTDDDLEKVGGQKDKLLGVIQEKYCYTREKAEEEFDRHMDEYLAATKKTGVTTA